MNHKHPQSTRSKNAFVFDIWYFAGLSTDIAKDTMIRREIAGEPICLGRRQDDTLFAMRDICPHRAAPFSKGCIKDGRVECPYHGWQFGTDDGICKEIPALTSEQSIETEKIKVRTFPVQQDGAFIWAYIASDKRFNGVPKSEPPRFPFPNRRAVMDDTLTLNCHVDHAVIGLMDPAHGPFVHRQWWWRSEKSMHDKAKAFEPRPLGFSMTAHSPSANSFAYKLLGGHPVTEITFQLPGIRTEHIKVGSKTLLSFTAVTPIDENKTRIRQIFFTDILMLKLLAPILAIFARKFLRQDADMVDLQQMGLKYEPNLLLIDDADTQAKWYYSLKKEWAKSRHEDRIFKNPIKPKTLKWRS